MPSRGGPKMRAFAVLRVPNTVVVVLRVLTQRHGRARLERCRQGGFHGERC